MNMCVKLLSVIFLILSEHIASAQIFQTEVVEVKTDTTLRSAALYRRQYFCLMTNNRMVVIDSTGKLQEQPGKVDKNIYRVVSLHDTLFAAGEENRVYYYNGKRFVYLRKGNIIPPLYADDHYTVTGSCSGEWGGSVYFTDNLSGIKYECQATCPLTVNKLNGSYIVTASLSHMMGSSEIIRITDPSKMTAYNRDHLKKRTTFYVGEWESKSTKGAEPVVDSIGLITLSAFLYGNELFHIISGSEGTAVAKISGSKFIPVQSISDLRFYYVESVANYGRNGVLNVFHSNERGGFIHIRENIITIFRFIPGN